MTPPVGLRAAGPADAPLLFALERAGEVELGVPATAALADAERELADPAISLWLRDDDAGGADLACGVRVREADEHLGVDITFTPAVTDDELRQVLAFALAVARRLDPTRRVHVGADARRPRWAAVLTGAGGVLVRRFGRMEIDLPADLRPPAAPAGVEVRRMQDTPADWAVLHAVGDTAFIDHYGHVPQPLPAFEAELRSWLPDLELIWLCHVDGEPAAALVAEARPADCHVDILATLRAFRGRGLGRHLMNVAFAEFVDRGYRRATLNLDLSNPTGALHLYESIGMQVTATYLTHEFASGDESSTR